MIPRPMHLAAAALFALAPEPFAQAPQPRGFPGTPLDRPRVEIPFNRLYDDVEIYALLDRLAAIWPQYLRHEVIGRSHEGRELRVYTLNVPATGLDREKPAMWVDANVHGNEIQGSEVCVYLLWYLLENYGTNARITELCDRVAFYVMPLVNPDGRASWVHGAHNAHSSRTGTMPEDDDRDGLLDEDGPNDLDGDGHITMMRKHVPGEGDWRLDPDDPRLMQRVPPNERGIRGDWMLLGSEGLDSDGDGRIGEDSVGGYDMNRAWPSMWRPEHVQGGAGAYPLYWPETRAIADFLIERENVAAVQSFHNAGGMILRGPGAEDFGEYPRADLRVYDELGKDGERMLPFYRYMIIWKDLYTVFGGFVTWTYEGLGIISFTNELWNSDQMFAGKTDPAIRDAQRWFDDKLLSGGGFVPWKPYQHPLYGEIEIGGFRKDVGRVPPSFMIEEMLHRNALFCIAHAEAMPAVRIEEPTLTELGGGLRAIDVLFRNERAIPTRSARAAEKKIGTPDLITLEGDGIEVLAGGLRRDRWRSEELELAEHSPARLVHESGIAGRSELRLRWIVRGSGEARIAFKSAKARDQERRFTLD